jgi:hypothetical protein
MKKACLTTLAFLLVVAGGAAQDPESYYAASFARLNYVSGDVFVQRTSDLGYEKGEVNLALVQGDKIGTEVGQAEVHFGHRNFLRIGQYSQVEFALLPREGDDRIKLHVLEGSVYLRVSRLEVEKSIEIHTPDASFYLLDIGLYRVNVNAGQESEFLVLEGSAEAAGEEGSLLVRAEEKITAVDGRFLGGAEQSPAGSDEFDEWNGTRDGLLAERSNTRYLPSDLDDYEEELDRGGTWVYERPYGYVWTPYAVDADWRPYLYGRWVWYPVIGWNWVSFEPWGWAVYHYGRWHWRIGLGWYWIPHHYWRPAWVHWWHHQSYIGWCPLSWYNRPVVIVNNYFYDRHYDPYFPAGNRAMTVIRRNQLQSPNAARHVVARAELASVGRIALKAEQPSARPVANPSSPLAAQARKVLSRTSARVAPKSYASPARPGNTGRSAPAGTPSVVRRGSLSRTPESPGAAAKPAKGIVRTFPSRNSAPPPASGSARPRTSGITRNSAREAGSKTSPAGAGSAKGVTPSKPGAASAGRVGAVKKGSEPAGKTTQTAKKIKTYASSNARLASSGERGNAPASSAAAQPRTSGRKTTYPSRLQTAPSSSARSSSRTSGQSAVSRSQGQRSAGQLSSRSSQPSLRTGRAPRSGSVSTPARSASPGSRSVSTRTAPSSSGRSAVSRPSSSRSSAPRSMSAPRSASSRSGSGASSKSSSSSRGKSGAVRKKD